MASWLKNTVGTAGAFGASWGGAVWYWRAGNRMPDGAELALWLLVLPLAVLALAWGVRAARRRAAAAAAAATAAVPAGAAAAAPMPAADAAPLPAGPAIVASALRTPHGDSAAALREALAAGVQPALDPELVDRQGYPVLSARVAGLDDGAVRDAFASMAPAGGIAAGAALSDAQWRALALAGAAAAELAQVLGGHPHIHGGRGGSKSGAQHAGAAAAAGPNAGPDARAAAPLPLLHLHCLWGGAWSPAQRAAADAFIARQLVAGGWPAQRLAVAARASAAGTTADVPPAHAPAGAAHDDADLAAILAPLAAHTGEARLALVLAGASMLGAASIDALAGAGALCGADTPQGMVPGEGAAALLLADPVQARLLAPDADVLPVLRAFAGAPRDPALDASRRVDAAPLRALARQALQTARCAPQQVAMLAADTDARSSRVMETMALASNELPHLDPAADLAATGAACGACAPVPLLAALALAADAALEHAAPVLCLGNLDARHRTAAVVAPSAADDRTHNPAAADGSIPPAAVPTLT
ncbi:hypothetical protein HH212_20105 [Massilia forsythiae]|uniref:3-oxoacyl-ACP synthase n=1 Tax=Massilia forsythiae TaxID=2728020 RepID=A0A7Z2ZTZ9_9BURK|nr:hypothetical protein [Massilia forsythiae]QJE02038.1 hypothetical protein HH212_20105 [Massilia forsythiae]